MNLKMFGIAMMQPSWWIRSLLRGPGMIIYSLPGSGKVCCANLGLVKWRRRRRRRRRRQVK